jgi:hypothetical protein
MAGFDTPFRWPEMVGVFRWNEALTERLWGNLPWLYHACHPKQFRQFHRRNTLFLRSTFAVAGSCEASTYECVWLSLHPWHQTHGNNHFGPITFKIPLDALNGRRFYVFKRELRGWTHVYIVQREKKAPLFGSEQAADGIDSTRLFLPLKRSSLLAERPSTQYEIVLTKSVPLSAARIIAADHPQCRLGRCHGYNKSEALEVIHATVEKELTRLADRFPQMKKMILHRTL